MTYRDPAFPLRTCYLFFAAGALARLWNLDQQILLGDELHAVRNALAHDLGTILTTSRAADSSIPLTALLHGLVEIGVQLDEGLVRLPSLLAGLTALVLLPRSRLLPQGDAVHTATFAGLLALSPCLIYYSRVAQPTMLMVLMAWLAASAFWQWWAEGRRSALPAYLLAAGAASWLHPGAVPAILAPVVFAAMEVTIERLRRETGFRSNCLRLLEVGAAATGVLGLVLLPSWSSLLNSTGPKSGRSEADLLAIRGVLELHAGSTYAPVVVVVLALAVGGMLSLLGRTPRRGLYLLSIPLVQWVAILGVLRPEALDIAIVLNRYVLVSLPIFLLCVAYGAARLFELLRRERGPGMVPTAAGLLAALLLTTHPYVEEPWLRLGSFAGSHTAAAFQREVPELPRDVVPPAYRRIAAEPGSRAVIELPGGTTWGENEARLAYSRVHDRPVLVATADPDVADPRLDLRRVLPIDPERIRQSSARFAVLDTRAHESVERIRRLEALGGAGTASPPIEPATLDLRRRCIEAWGPPDLRDGTVEVWDLDRVRRLMG